MSRELSYLEAIREGLAEEMRRDTKVFVLGEDVGPYGGAFGVTQGLSEEFGELRVVDTPISESAIIGISVGASLRGYRPVAEMQFADFISCGFDQIVNQAATLRYRYGGRASVPIVVRAPSGGGVRARRCALPRAPARRGRSSCARRAAAVSAAASITRRTRKRGSCIGRD